MTPIRDRIICFGDRDIIYPYEGDPHIFTQTASPYRVNVDPFPAYPHNDELVHYEARHNEQCFPLSFDVVYHILEHEMLWRVNGCACFDADPLKGWIVLSGKRIPIHPAITRSLVAHEYGHVVYGWIKHSTGGAFLREYYKLRGFNLNPIDSNGPRSWHTHFEEIAVNDFRILVAGREDEFWPHPVRHPTLVKGLSDFWKDLKRLHASS